MIGFTSLARGLSAALGGPYHDALLHWPGVPVVDDGGSIVSPGVPVEVACSAQVDSVTDAMRRDGYVDGDVRLLILAETVDTNARLAISDGPFADTEWMLSSITRDPFGIYWEARGRRA